MTCSKLQKRYSQIFEKSNGFSGYYVFFTWYFSYIYVYRMSFFPDRDGKSFYNGANQSYFIKIINTTYDDQLYFPRLCFSINVDKWKCEPIFLSMPKIE